MVKSHVKQFEDILSNCKEKEDLIVNTNSDIEVQSLSPTYTENPKNLTSKTSQPKEYCKKGINDNDMLSNYKETKGEMANTHSDIDVQDLNNTDCENPNNVKSETSQSSTTSKEYCKQDISDKKKKQLVNYRKKMKSPIMKKGSLTTQLAWSDEFDQSKETWSFPTKEIQDNDTHSQNA